VPVSGRRPREGGKQFPHSRIPPDNLKVTRQVRGRLKVALRLPGTRDLKGYDKKLLQHSLLRRHDKYEFYYETINERSAGQAGLI